VLATIGAAFLIVRLTGSRGRGVGAVVVIIGAACALIYLGLGFVERSRKGNKREGDKRRHGKG